ncbi:MAG TPA: hypothetical protein VK536_10740 [Candidatus Limnocylindrales bacterium]|nr:hypothetical protein [Candidatus Limnocylindrales bacterium]
MREVFSNTDYQSVLQKYWICILLLVLALASFPSNYIALFTAFVFTFLVPGLICYRFFKLKSHEIWAFVPLFSVMVSAEFIYYLSLAVGYSRETILFSFLALTSVYALIVYRKGEPIQPSKLLRIKQIKKTSLLLFASIFTVALIVLFISVWRGSPYGIVLTGSNWQDTPLHYEIIESINNGNFPPQMPNFAGVPMTYYYFVDFHTAIVEKVFGYLPQLLPFLNAVFILIFGFAIYALTRPNGRRAAIIATVIATFGWGLSYFGLFNALFTGTFNVTTNYGYQYGGTFGLPPIFDNLLQQRPLLIGLPVFAFVLALFRDMNSKNRLFLAGLMTGLLFEFHNVAFLCCYLAFVVAVLFNFKQFKLTNALYFLLPTALALPFIFHNGPPATISLSTVWIANFAHDPPVYYLLNLGIPFVIALVSFVRPGNEVLKGTMIFLVLIPNILLITPNPWDMYKFFIFAWIPIAVLAGIMLSKTRKILIVTLVLLSILTSSSVIIYNVGTNFPAASWQEYQLGLWVRSNTPEDSVFLTSYNPGIHCPVAFIGGRLTVSSYINWPYGWGIPLSQIYQRQNDINAAYTGNATELQQVVTKYHVSYVYVGTDELTSYPGCTARFNAISWLKPVYTNGNLEIYQVELN